MATATNLSRALEIYNDRYQDALNKSSNREIDRFRSTTNQINTYYDIVLIAISDGENTRAQNALDEIVAILNAEGIYISDDVGLPLAVSIYPSPAVITVPVDEIGENPVFTNAYSTIHIFRAGIDVTSDYTISITSESNVSATIQAFNQVRIVDISADTGSVSIQAQKTGYEDLVYTINVYKYYNAKAGITLVPYPGTILIPTDSDGTNPVLTNAISTQVGRVGTNDETDQFTFSIVSQTNVTAVIQNDNEVKINAITDEQGSVTVRASRTGYDNMDYDIAIQKQRKGQAVVDSSSVDSLTIDLNDSSELILRRDQTGADNIFNVDTPDFSSFTIVRNSTSNEDHRFRSNNFRRVESQNDNGGYSTVKNTFNIAQPISVLAYESQGNVILGSRNKTEYLSGTSNDAELVTPNADGTTLSIVFPTSSGDLTAYYLVDDKLLVYAEIASGNIDSVGVGYYMSGTVTSSSYGTFTLVTIDCDYIFTDTHNDYFSDRVLAGDEIKVVTYTPYDSTFGTIGSFYNKVFGDNNEISGRDNYVIGGSNTLINSWGNLILGSGWEVNPTSQFYLGVTGNVLIGIGLGWSGDANQIKGHGNVIIANNDSNVIDHEDNNFNIIVGYYNAIGEYAIPQTFGGLQNIAVGTRNKLPTNFSQAYGYGGTASGDGEIVMSTSDSEVNKVIFILEGSSTTTDAFLLKTLERGSSSGVNPASFASSPKFDSNTVFTGTLYLSATDTDDGYCVRKWPLLVMFSSIGTTEILSPASYAPLGTGMADYAVLNKGVSVTLITTTANELGIQITPGDAVESEWSAILEGHVDKYAGT